MPPLGLCYLAAVARQSGFSGAIEDLCIKPKNRLHNLKNILAARSAKIYGLSASIFNLPAAKAIVEEIKRMYPDAWVVLGGPCTAFSPSTLFQAVPSADIIVFGEGEASFLRILQTVRSGSDLRSVDIPGTVAKWNFKKDVCTPEPMNVNMNALPFPARDMTDVYRYHGHPPFELYPPITTVETMRGCPYQCNFCTIRHTVKVRDIDKVVAEISHITARYGFREIYFVDPTFTADRDRTLKLCESLVKKNFDLHWTCKSRVDLLDDELAQAMYRAGCYMMSLGAESGNQSMLNVLNKGTTVDQIVKGVSTLSKVGIRSLMYFMVASPGETDQSIADTVRILKQTKADFLLVGELLPDPSSGLFKTMCAEGKTSEADLLKLYAGDYEKVLHSGFFHPASRRAIKQWMRKLMVGFYFRPSYFYQRMIGLRNMRDLTNLIHGGFLLASEIVRFLLRRSD